MAARALLLASIALLLTLCLSTDHGVFAQEEQRVLPNVQQQLQEQLQQQDQPQLQQVQPAQPTIKTPGAGTNVKPTGGVAEYKCDSEKNTCKCTSASDCNKMRTDKACAKDMVCHEDECWCTWH